MPFSLVFFPTHFFPTHFHRIHFSYQMNKKEINSGVAMKDKFTEHLCDLVLHGFMAEMLCN